MSSLFIGTGFKQTDAGVIPEEWESVKAGEVGRFRGGNGFPLRFQGETARDYPFYKVSDMNNEGNDTFMVDSNNWISEGVRKQLSATAFPADSIIFAKVGAAVFLERKKILTKPSCIDNNLAALVLDKTRTHVRFVHYSLLNIKFGTFVTATALPSLSGTVLSQITFALPPLPEQRAIAEALSDMDALISRLDQLITKKRDLKQAAMQQLLTGHRRLPGFNGAWEVKRLGEIGESLIGLTYKPSDVRDNGVLVLRSSNVFEGALRFEDNVFVEMEIPERIMVRDGDILICVRNGSRDLIGKCAKIDKRAQGMTFGAFMAVFRTQLHKFVYYQFQSDVIKRQIQEHLGATINQITNKSLNSFEVPIPVDLDEQSAIATVLSDMDAELAALEARRDKTRDLKQGMMQELLTGRIRLV